MKATKPNIPPFLRGIPFTYQRPEKDSPYPNNCPFSVEFKDPSGKGNVKIESATKKYQMLGFYPVYKTLRWGFDEDPNFDWKNYWEWQCDMDKNSISPDQIVEELDAMHRANLGDLDTGATTLMGFIGQKAVRDGDMKLAQDIFSRLIDFSNFVETGIDDPVKFKGVADKGEKACVSDTGDRRANCDDTQSRSYLGVGMMVRAAVENGLINDNPDPKLVKKELTIENIGEAPDVSLFKDDPYKIGSEYLLRCMVESENDTLKRDQCTESIKDVMFSALKTNALSKDKDVKDRSAVVFKDMLTHLNQYYIVKDNKLQDAETWVNTTIWKADALIDGLLIEEKSGDKSPLTEMLLKDGLVSQLKEDAEEFSAATWSGEQIVNIMANMDEGTFKGHDAIIKQLLLARDAKGRFRINIWNGWMRPYLDRFKPSGISSIYHSEKEETFPVRSHSKEQNDALISIVTGINTGCLIPTLQSIKKDPNSARTGINIDAIENCAGASKEIIEKSDDEDVLYDALDTYFYYGQEGLGIEYNKEIKDKMQAAINKRFTANFTRNLAGSNIYETIGNVGDVQIAEDPSLEPYKGWTKSLVVADILMGRGKESGRLYKKDGKNYIYKKYAFEHLIPPEEMHKQAITRIILAPEKAQVEELEAKSPKAKVSSSSKKSRNK